MAGEVGDRHLHAEADAEERDLLLARDPRGLDLALDPAHAEAAGDEDAVGAGEPLADLESSSVSESTQSISIAQPCWKPEWRSASTTDLYASSSWTYLPTSAIFTGGRCSASPARAAAVPAAQVGRRGLEVEVLEHEVVDALGPELTSGTL